MNTRIMWFISLSLLLWACSGEQETSTEEIQEVVKESTPQDTKEEAKIEEAPTMNGILESSSNFQTLATAIQAAGMEATLDQANITLLAPNNDAFMALGEEKIEELLDPKNKAKLKKVLSVHIVKGKLDAQKLKDGETLTTLAGTQLKVTVNGGQISIGDANIVASNIEAKNGMIHAIDKVL